MSTFDVALAPSGNNNLFRGKSDLRWLEASALGIPVVGDPAVYPEIEDGITGSAALPIEVTVMMPMASGKVSARSHALDRGTKPRRSSAIPSTVEPRRVSSSPGSVSRKAMSKKAL